MMKKLYILTTLALTVLFAGGQATLFAQMNEPGMNPQAADENYDYLIHEAGIGETQNYEQHEGEYLDQQYNPEHYRPE